MLGWATRKNSAIASIGHTTVRMPGGGWKLLDYGGWDGGWTAETGCGTEAVDCPAGLTDS